jgi:hypothetical protein
MVPALASTMVRGVATFSSNAALAVTILKVEPGSYRSWIARLRRVSSRGVAIGVGIESGALASARISPVYGSMITADPPEAPLHCTPSPQLALGDVLEVLVDRQLECGAGRPVGVQRG